MATAFIICQIHFFFKSIQYKMFKIPYPIKEMLTFLGDHNYKKQFYFFSESTTKLSTNLKPLLMEDNWCIRCQDWKLGKITAGISPVIIKKIFLLVPNCSKCITWLNIPQLKLEISKDIPHVIFPNFETLRLIQKTLHFTFIQDEKALWGCYRRRNILIYS